MLLDEQAPTCLDDAYLTHRAYQVKKVIVCKAAGMKEMWVLASSISNIATQTLLNYYSKRWSTETSYRDEKNYDLALG